MSDYRYGDQEPHQYYPGARPAHESADGPYGSGSGGNTSHQDTPYGRPPPSAPYGGYPHVSGGSSAPPPQSGEYGYPPSSQHQSYPSAGLGQHQSAEYGYPPSAPSHPSYPPAGQQHQSYPSAGQQHQSAEYGYPPSSAAYGQQQPHGYGSGGPGVHSTSQSSTKYHPDGRAESVSHTYATGTGTTQEPASHKPNKPNKPNDKFGELGALAAGAYSLFKEHKVKTDSSGHRVEESTTTHASTGSGTYSTYEQQQSGSKPEKEKHKKPAKAGSLGELGSLAQEAYALYEQHAGGKTKVEGGHGKQEAHGAQGTGLKPEKDKKNSGFGELGSLAAEGFALYQKTQHGKTDTAGGKPSSGKPSSGGSGSFADAAKLGKQAFSAYQKHQKTNRDLE